MDSFFDHFRIQNIRLKVLNLDTASKFYRVVIGLREIVGEERIVRFSANGQEPALVVLEGDPGALARAVASPGLFHTALLFPDRRELARTIRHVVEKGWRFQGFADHGVSEAAYLADSEGNGLELYRDRPRDEWPMAAGANEVAMVTNPLDVAGLMSEVTDSSSSYDGIHPDVHVGHIHLQVSSLDKAKGFYHDLLRLDITQQNYPGALFLSANGYHHHIGLNIWNSKGSQPAGEHAAGLKSFGITTTVERLGQIADRVRSRGDSLVRTDAQRHHIVDSDGIKLNISTVTH